MWFPPEQVSILRAALELWHSVVVDGETSPSVTFVGNLQQHVGLSHVHGWFPPQLDETSVAAHRTNLSLLESKLLHAEQCQTRGIKRWIRRGELPDDVEDVDAALEVAGHLMDKACVAEILGVPLFLGTDGLFYVIDLQADVVLCDPDFAKEYVDDFVDELLNDPADFDSAISSHQLTIDEVLKNVEQHREAIQRMFGAPQPPAAADIKGEPP